MNDQLDQEAKAFVQRAVAAERPPSNEVRRRVRAAVCAAAPAGALIGSGAAQAAAKAAAGLGVKLAGWAAGGFLLAVGVATTAHVVGLPSEPAPPSERSARQTGPDNATARTASPRRGEAPATVVPAPSSGPRTIGADEPGAGPPNRSRPPGPPAPVGSDARAPDTPAASSALAEEVRILEHVQENLRDGDAEAALQVLHAQDVRFTHSQLRPDFEVARVLAWCELGQTEEARRAAERFLSRYPESGLAARVRQSCAFKAEEPKQDSSRPGPVR
jgi:hypothetical protein